MPDAEKGARVRAACVQLFVVMHSRRTHARLVQFVLNAVDEIHDDEATLKEIRDLFGEPLLPPPSTARRLCICSMCPQAANKSSLLPPTSTVRCLCICSMCPRAASRRPLLPPPFTARCLYICSVPTSSTQKAGVLPASSQDCGVDSQCVSNMQASLPMHSVCFRLSETYRLVYRWVV